MSRRVKVSKLKEAIRVLVLQELNEQENDKPEHFGGGENIDILGYQTKHFDICKSAVILYQKLMEKELNDKAKELVVSSAKEMDHLFEMEKQVVNGEEVDHDPVEHGIELTNIISFQLGRVAEMINDDFERDTSFIKMHVMEIVKRHKREVDEVSTTGTAGTYPGGPGHYFTPFAFSGGRKKDKKKRKKIATAGGYKPVNESQPFADFPKFPKLSRAQQESLDELFGFAESYQIFNSFNSNPKKFVQTLDDMAKIRKASNKQPKGVNFNKGKKEFVKEVSKQEVNALRNLVKGIGNLKKDFSKATKVGDRELMKKDYNKHYETLLDAEKAMVQLMQFFKTKEMLGEGRYHDWRNDESLTPKQKIGKSMREIRDALNELDKTVKMNLKLKTELNMSSQDYWKNTHKALTKISERLVKMANKVGNLK